MRDHSDSSYVLTTLNGWSIIIHPEVDLEEVFDLLFKEGRLQVYDGSRMRRVKSNRKACIYKTILTFRDMPASVYVKRFHLHSTWCFVNRMFRAGRAKKAFEATIMLRECGFDVAKPLVILERSIGPFRTESIFITKEVQNSVQLSRKLQELSADSSTFNLRQKRKLISEFGKIVGKLHNKKILHGDLRPRNVLVQKKDNYWSFWLIDNERTKRFSRFTDNLARKNLVQMINVRIHASYTDRMRFMRAYGQERGLTKSKVKEVARAAMERIWWRKLGKIMKNPIKEYKKRYGKVLSKKSF